MADLTVSAAVDSLMQAADVEELQAALELDSVATGVGEYGATAPGTQPAAIANVAGGSTVDAEARTAINAILAVLRNKGTIAT